MSGPVLPAMSSLASEPAALAERQSPAAAVAPIAGIVFAAFFVIGLAMPVLPLHVHLRLGMGAFVVGLVAGSQFTASLISRLWAGRIADTRGPKRAVLLGLVASVAGGACYLLSLLFLTTPILSVAVLLVGRFLVGGAESLIVTGATLWGMGRLPANRSAQVIAWTGMSMFAAMAIAAPLGSLVSSASGFFGIALASFLVPLLALGLVVPLKPLAPSRATRATVTTVLAAVMLPGIGFALSGVTFGAVTAFLTLYFNAQGWTGGALAFTSFAVALIATRLFAGHLPDRFGGARIALYSLGVQAVGLAVAATAPAGWVAVLGITVAGIGFSLVFPGFGLEAVTRVPPASRGTAMGTYNAFTDLTLGIGSPALGLLASQAGIRSVFEASATAAVMAIPIAWHLQRRGTGCRSCRATVMK